MSVHKPWYSTVAVSSPSKHWFDQMFCSLSFCTMQNDVELCGHSARAVDTMVSAKKKPKKHFMILLQLVGLPMKLKWTALLASDPI
jgi:hypothetical protein